MALDKKSPDVILEGRISNIRKFESGGKGYEALAFDLALGTLQNWPCAVFGRNASQVRKLGEDAWGRFNACVTSLRGPKGWTIGLKVESASVTGAAKTRQERVTLTEAVTAPAGRRGWIEIMTADGMSYCLESPNQDQLETIARKHPAGSAIDAIWRDSIILARHGKDQFVPVMASELIAIEAAKAAPAQKSFDFQTAA